MPCMPKLTLPLFSLDVVPPKSSSACCCWYEVDLRTNRLLSNNDSNLWSYQVPKSENSLRVSGCARRISCSRWVGVSS